MRISTLVRYVDALGGELVFVIRLKNGSEVVWTPPYHGDNGGSHPRGDAIKRKK